MLCFILILKFFLFFKFQLTYLIGAGLTLVACAWIFFGTHNDSFKKYGIFGVSVIIGMSSTTILITSLGITNDLIGSNTVST